jgi:AraC-like DNA-binding protein
VVESCELAWSFLLPLAHGRSPADQLAERAMALLTARWQDPPNLAALARQLRVSREHLSRLLRATCGQPPGLWLRRYRLERSADLLESGHAVAEVAQACGYSSVPHFIAAFHRFKGTTPGRWLRDKQVRAAVAPPR